jgi:hypothetical protein
MEVDMVHDRGRIILIVLAHAFAGWVLCAAAMGIGMALMSLQSALIVHAVLAPVFFAALSIIYFKKFAYTKPLATAAIFLIFVVVVDFFVVALLINRSLDMFGSALGTWIPFVLIFISTYITGMIILRRDTPQPGKPVT